MKEPREEDKGGNDEPLLGEDLLSDGNQNHDDDRQKKTDATAHTAANAANSSTGPSKPKVSTPAPPSLKPLVIDEIEAAAQASPRRSTLDPSLIKGGVIGPMDLRDGSLACPCCRRYVAADGKQISDAARSTIPLVERHHGHNKNKKEEHHEKDDEESNLSGLLNRGSEYLITKELASGWVHKKGSGNDWFGSRAWKPRWARLVLAKVSGFDVDVPLLLIYWYTSSPKPSTIIMLDSTVIMPVDRFKEKDKDGQNKAQWNTYCFDVVHVKKGSPDAIKKQEKVTRTFTVPRKERNEWVFAISQALMDYEKRSMKARSERARSPLAVERDDGRWGGGRGRAPDRLPPRSPPRRANVRRSPSPNIRRAVSPLAPRPLPLPLPRHD